MDEPFEAIGADPGLPKVNCQAEPTQRLERAPSNCHSVSDAWSKTAYRWGIADCAIPDYCARLTISADLYCSGDLMSRSRMADISACARLAAPSFSYSFEMCVFVVDSLM